MRTSLVWLVLLAALAVALPASARTTSTWPGTWDTSWGPLVLTGSGGSLSGAFGYEDSWNEPLGHLTGAASGNVLSGTWSHDPPSHFAPRDHGNFTFTLLRTTDGRVVFTGEATYTVDGQRVSWSGTCKSGLCAQDRQAPTATALRASGKAGGTIALRYRVAGDGGKTSETVTVYRNAVAIWKKTTALRPVTSGATYQVVFRAPKAGPLRFSVEARDAAGNRSVVSYAAIVLR
jgi:hypothetical protein